MVKKLFTSESVSCGHPDFVASSISDAIIDHCLRYDNRSRCGIEVLCTPNRVTLGGEVTTSAPFDKDTIEHIVRQTVINIGYVNPEAGFCGCEDPECPHRLTIDNFIHKQSPDINQGVDNGVSTGAGDQGIMFGFASNETREYYPLAAQIANELMRQYMRILPENTGILYPDAKSQVTIDYDNNNHIDVIVIAASHKEDVKYEDLYEVVKNQIIVPALQNVILKDGSTAESLFDEDTNILVNTTGKFVIHGPFGDAGVNGRKLAVDSYGGYARIGGGNSHGKDVSKTDTTLAFYTRYLAKNLVAAGIASKLEIQLATAIGVAEPVSVAIDTFGTGIIPDAEIAEKLLETQDMTLDNIIEQLNLYETERISTNTQFTFGVPAGETGEDVLKYHHTWERLDKVDEFKQIFNL